MVTTKLTLREFLELPEGETSVELVDGQAVPKRAGLYHHVRLQSAIERLLANWGSERGRVEREWSVILRRREQDWVSVPDALFISFERLPADWNANETCPAIPELVVEVASPGQPFGELAAKAEDYLAAGVDRVWVVDSAARILTVYFPNLPPHTLSGDEQMGDPLLSGLAFSLSGLFRLAGLS